MPATTFRLTIPALCCAALAGCGSFSLDGLTGVPGQLANSITPYKVEIVQGNFVSREQVEALKPGMGRQQVRDILGTPLVASVFHTNRWDYVFTLKRQGVAPQSRKLTVYFKGNELERFEGDPMPSEAEFVAGLDNHRKTGRIPPLEATPEALAKFPAGKPAVQPVTAEAPPAMVYPPLEPAR